VNERKGEAPRLHPDGAVAGRLAPGRCETREEVWISNKPHSFGIVADSATAM